MRISTIFFDLGSTLVYSKDPWSPIFIEADQALTTALRKAGISLRGKASNTEYSGFLDTYYAERGDSVIEKTATGSLKEILVSEGNQDVADVTLRTALDSMYAVTQRNWYLEEDAIPTLEILRQRGLRLGLISNTSDDKNVQQLIDRFCLRSYFECIVTSAGCGIRKPDGRIFQMALNHFQVPPQGVMMVGDTLEADALGANLKGIYSVWITRRVTLPGEGELVIQPQAVISSLAQIPGLLTELELE
jgi:putative hydrolase of the HAD superfamily